MNYKSKHNSTIKKVLDKSIAMMQIKHCNRSSRIMLMQINKFNI
jgi:hypothetical protein